MRIAIVNDESLAVEALRRAIADAPEHSLAWIARNGAEAVARCAADRPDVLLMDLLMPVMDGVEATRRIMAESPCPILIVTGDVTRNTSKVFAAMGAGALDVVATPVLAGEAALASTRAMMTKVRFVAQVGVPARARRSAATGSRSVAASSLIAIGASAGGPPAVAHVLRDLPADLRAAVLVVQHVDSEFVESMADWFDSQATFAVSVAREGQVPEIGHVYMAAGDSHLVVRPTGTLGCEREPADALYRPSADVLFESVARHWKGPAIGVVLSGMGRDGAAGLGLLRATGACTIAQDEQSSAVYGMPRAAAEADAATDVLPLGRIAGFITDRVRRHERPAIGRDVPSAPNR
jgi:two-component system response regulator WspF